MIPILKSAAGTRENQDRACVISDDCGVVLLLADGAGGVAGGAEAAAMVVELAQQYKGCLRDPSGCASVMQAMDQLILQEESAGETTCALAVVRGGQSFGSSVGDSGVWILSSTSTVDLTRNQARKPLIGSGSARPVEFSYTVAQEDKKLLLATDGLLKYASGSQIVEVCRARDDEGCAAKLIELVRYPSGRLPDDVTVILATL
jgi:serine/threonine protein phosphatase PrpC